MERIDTPVTELLKQEPNVELAFVETLADNTKFAQLITSFSNTEGGVLIIGVNSKKKIIGIDPVGASQIISDCNNALCSPVVDYSLSKEIVGRFFILKMTINKGVVKHFVQDDEKMAYYRVGGDTIKENKVLKMLWSFSQGNKQALTISMCKEVLSIITDKISISLSQLYKKSDKSKGDIELVLAFLLFEKRIISNVNDDVVMYSIL